MATAVAPETADKGKDQQAPFAGYPSFEGCLFSNQDKENPEAYCRAVQNTVTGRGTVDDLSVIARSMVVTPPVQPTAGPTRSMVVTPPVDSSPMAPSPGGTVLRLEAIEPLPLPLDTDQAKRVPDSASPMGLNSTLAGQPEPQRTDGAMLSSATADPQDSQARDHLGLGGVEGALDYLDVPEDERDELLVQPPTGGDFIEDRSGSDSVKAGEIGQDREDDDKAKDARAESRGSPDQPRDDHGRWSDVGGTGLSKGDTLTPHGPHAVGLHGGKFVGTEKSKITGQTVAKIVHPDGTHTLIHPRLLGKAFVKTGSEAPKDSKVFEKITSVAEIAGGVAATAALAHELLSTASASPAPTPAAAPDSTARTVDGSPGSAEALLPLQQMGVTNRPLNDPVTGTTPVVMDDDVDEPVSRGLDGSTKQEIMEDAKKRNRLIEQENIGVPVPNMGTGPLGPANTPKLAIADQPTDKGGLIPPDNKTLDMGATPPIVPKVGAPGKKKGALSRVCDDRTVPHSFRAITEEKLPSGICGRVQFVGLRYNEVDTYNTTFLPGCLNKSRNDKLTNGLIKLYRQIVSGEVHPHGVDTHIGVVRSMVDVGDDVICTADILDTEDGRRIKEYLTAAIPNGGTGASIGFVPRAARPIMRDNKRVNAFTEVEIMEFTVTPINSVPGTDILSVRAAADSKDAESSPAPADTAATGTAARGGEIASMESRIEAVRRSMRFIFC